MEFFTNPWFIGIGGGVFSGFVVTLISRRIFSRRDNKEYHQKIITANHEILYAIRPSISEKKIPKREIIEAIRSATAQKYSIELQDLYKLTEIIDILIKEVMDSSFISMDAKTNYCTELANLKIDSTPKIDFKEEQTKEISVESTKYYKYKERMLTMMSTTLGMMTAVMTMVVYLFSKEETPVPALFSESMLPLLTITLAAVMSVMMATLLTNIRRKHKDKREDIEKEKIN
ncbi:MAG: hypothetical protein JW983_09315 [Elusimicrobia bacterium]|nr:hypothetical protein [Elusimicrobiota bacterium]